MRGVPIGRQQRATITRPEDTNTDGRAVSNERALELASNSQWGYRWKNWVSTPCRAAEAERQAASERGGRRASAAVLILQSEIRQHWLCCLCLVPVGA